MQRMEFWQRNLSQIATVMISSSIEKDQIQTAYEDLIAKYHEVTTFPREIRRRNILYFAERFVNSTAIIISCFLLGMSGVFLH